MKSYLNALKERAEECNVSLLRAFQKAEIPTSTYYRTVQNKTELRFDTAAKVMNAVEELYSLQQARDHTAELRESGQPVDRRSIRAKYKPRRIGA